MKKYKVEVTHGQDQRTIEADSMEKLGDWLIFFRNPPTGGKVEYWRVRIECVVCMETIS